MVQLPLRVKRTVWPRVSLEKAGGSDMNPVGTRLWLRRVNEIGLRRRRGKVEASPDAWLTEARR